MAMSVDNGVNFGRTLVRTATGLFLAGSLGVATLINSGCADDVETDSTAQLDNRGQKDTYEEGAREKTQIPEDIDNIMRNEFFEDWRSRISVLMPDSIILIGSWGKQTAEVNDRAVPYLKRRDRPIVTQAEVTFSEGFYYPQEPVSYSYTLEAIRHGELMDQWGLNIMGYYIEPVSNKPAWGGTATGFVFGGITYADTPTETTPTYYKWTGKQTAKLYLPH